jgi:hypothetical protein
MSGACSTYIRSVRNACSIVIREPVGNIRGCNAMCFDKQHQRFSGNENTFRRFFRNFAAYLSKYTASPTRKLQFSEGNMPLVCPWHDRRICKLYEF